MPSWTCVHASVSPCPSRRVGARASARRSRRGRRRSASARARSASTRRRRASALAMRVEGAEALAVAAELDERVADDAVVPCRRRRDRLGAAAERERVAEAVARERERAEAARRDQVVRRELQRAAQRLARLRVVGRIAGLARALLVREPELVERGRRRTGSRARPPAPRDDLRRALRREARRRRDGARARGGVGSTPPSRSATAVIPAAAAPKINSFRSRFLLQPGRRGPPAEPGPSTVLRIASSR